MNIRHLAAAAVLLFSLVPATAFAVASDLPKQIQACTGMEEAEAETCFDSLVDGCAGDRGCEAVVSVGRDHAEVIRARAEKARLEREVAELRATASAPAPTPPPAPAAPASVPATPIPTDLVAIVASGAGFFIPTDGMATASVSSRPCSNPMCLPVRLLSGNSAFGVQVNGEDVPVLYAHVPRPAPTRSGPKALWVGNGAQGSINLDFADPGQYSVTITEYYWNESRAVWERLVSRTSTVDIGRHSFNQAISNRDGLR